MKLTHFRLCPMSRSIRLAMAELGLEPTLVEELPWQIRPGFLAVNPAGELPVLELGGGIVLCGAYSISEFLAEEATAAQADERTVLMFPGSTEDRAEVRRLVDWFHGKLAREVTLPLLAEKVYGRQSAGAAPPNADLLRAVRVSLRYHLGYIAFLADQRRWLAGDELAFCDLAAAAHLSVMDYLGEVPWDEFQQAKSWYVRLKSRRSFQPLLADRMPGMPPGLAYTDLDF
jgi:glutathione S-transferase